MPARVWRGGVSNRNLHIDHKQIDTDEDTGTKHEHQGPSAQNLSAVLRFAADQMREDTPHPLKRKRQYWSDPKLRSVCSLRLGDIKRLIVGMFGGPCDTDDGELFFDLALVHLVARHVTSGKNEDEITDMLMDWAWKHTRKVVADHPREWFRDQGERILLAFDNDDGRPTIPSGDSVSAALGIRQSQVIDFKLSTLTAVERPRSVRKAEERAKKAERERQRRAKAGAVAHTESITQTKPWDRYGVSRATYYRAVKDGTIIPDQRMRVVRSRKQAKQIVQPEPRKTLRLVAS